MKERILTGWTLPRVFYLGAGLFLLISAIPDGQWFEILFGGYFTAMGLFGFGCAGGNCAVQPPAERAVFKTENVKSPSGSEAGEQ